MTNADFAMFATGGDAVFTLTSKRTGAAYTYHVQIGQGGEPGAPSMLTPPFFVRLLTGPDNTSDFTYIGLIQRKSGPGCMEFRTTKASKLPVTATPVAAFAYSWRNRMRLDKAGVEFRHAGRCAKCGRPLTTPESIDRGFGPECWARMGGA